MHPPTPKAPMSAKAPGAYRWAGRPKPHLPQWRRTTRWLLTMQTLLGVWFWGVILILVLVAIVVAVQFGPVEVSMFQFATHAALWFPFANMIIISAAMITTHVAQGRTRLSFIQACLITVVVMGLSYGLLMTAGLALEGALYDALGWSQQHIALAASETSSISKPIAPWQEPIGMTLLTYATRTAGGAMGGLLVGMTYYRFRGWRGTGLLVLMALPALAAQDSISGFLRQATDSTLLLNAVLSLVLIGAGALTYYFLTRRVPITTPRS